jgi:LuxR family transcriptional regulator, activator of tox operons
MDVRSLAGRAAFNDPFRRDIGRMVETVGTPDFEHHLFRAAQEAIQCEHLSAFAISPGAMPRLLLAANHGTAPMARSAGSAYVGHYWHADPTNQLMSDVRGMIGGLLVSLSGDEMLRLPYRRQCYSRADWESTGINLIHKISLIKSRDDGIIKVNFYRHRSAGPFTNSDQEKIAEISGLLFSFLVRHAPAGPRADARSLRKPFEQCLMQVSKGITPRETQVCAAIAVGMSSAGIASDLNISLNTVLTYRKRAYARLAISSQNELLRLLYTHLPATQHSIQ